jgi:hypothetical protein
MAAAERGQTRHLAWHPERLAATASYVADTVRRRYPSLDVPYHSRWRHFEAEGVDRWAQIAVALPADRAERARTRIDLALTSVLLDAGAGPAWRYTDRATDDAHALRGLGGELRLFAAGAFLPRAPCTQCARAGGPRQPFWRRTRFAGQSAAGSRRTCRAAAPAGRRRGGHAAVFTPARLGHLYDYLSRTRRRDRRRFCSPRCCARWVRMAA